MFDMFETRKSRHGPLNDRLWSHKNAEGGLVPFLIDWCALASPFQRAKCWQIGFQARDIETGRWVKCANPPQSFSVLLKYSASAIADP